MFILILMSNTSVIQEQNLNMKYKWIIQRALTGLVLMFYAMKEENGKSGALHGQKHSKE